MGFYTGSPVRIKACCLNESRSVPDARSLSQMKIKRVRTSQVAKSNLFRELCNDRYSKHAGLNFFPGTKPRKGANMQNFWRSRSSTEVKPNVRETPRGPKYIVLKGKMVRLGRFELSTSCFGGTRSIHLSYSRTLSFIPRFQSRHAACRFAQRHSNS